MIIFLSDFSATFDIEDGFYLGAVFLCSSDFQRHCTDFLFVGRDSARF